MTELVAEFQAYHSGYFYPSSLQSPGLETVVAL